MTMAGLLALRIPDTAAGAVIHEFHLRLANHRKYCQTECQNREEKQLSLIQHTLILSLCYVLVDKRCIPNGRLCDFGQHIYNKQKRHIFLYRIIIKFMVTFTSSKIK
jgi:hypothetical protein